MAIEYPSWVYDPLGVNPPMLVNNDDQFQALITAPLAPGDAALTNPPAPPPTIPTPLQKAAGVTTPPANSRWTKQLKKGH